MAFLLVLMAAAICALTGRSLRRDPRWLGNVGLLPLAVVSVATALTALRLPDPIALAVVLLVGASPLLISVLIVFLIWNGIDVLRREGVSVAHGLSLALGVGLLALLAGCVASVFAPWPWVFDGALAVGLWCAWLGALLVGYIGYSFGYERLARRRRPDYVVTLGSGLIGERVPPRLARRIDRALDIYRAGASAGRAPLLVMSGGQGSDEAVAEGEAMAAYARARGVPDADLRVETASRSTQENLRYSYELVRADPRMQPGVRGIAVTSNYHALRAAVTARALGLPIDAVGAPVAWYYWPSAMLREGVAIARMHWRFVLVSGLLVSLPLPALLAYAQYA